MRTLLTFILAASAFVLYGQDTDPVPKSRLDELVAEKGSPLVYNKQVGEYQLVWTNREANRTLVHTVPLKFDPFTGKELSSRRGELFVEPSDAESQEVSKKLQSCRSIDDVIKQFGKPDRVWPKTGGYSQYDFEKAFKTLKLAVKVADDGSLTPIVTGKQTKNRIEQ